jgi:hypothetical protein
MPPAQTVGFLHTAQVHVATFDALVGEVDDRRGIHHVDASLLDDARTHGITDELTKRIGDALRSLVGRGAIRIVCTCSTIGDGAELEGTRLGFDVVRVDRPLAQTAVASGARILVVAALETALQTTVALLRSVATEEHEVIPFLVAGSWELFEANDMRAYFEVIAAAVKQSVAAHPIDVVVLAQASMTAAQDLLRDLDVPVLTSPQLAVEFAFRQ